MSSDRQPKYRQEIQQVSVSLLPLTAFWGSRSFGPLVSSWSVDMDMLGCLPVHDMASVWLGVGAHQFAKGGHFAWDGVF